MMRRSSRLLSAVAAAGVVAGWAGAQTPTAAPAVSVPTPKADAAPAAGVMTLKVAGLPDRKVRVVKSTKSADGRVVTEVKDVATGETLLVGDKAAGGKADAVATTVPSVPSVKSTTLAADVKGPPTTLVPKAKTRDADPLLNGGSKSPAAMTAAAAPVTKPTTLAADVKGPPTTLMAKAPEPAKAPAPKPLPKTMPSAIAAKPAAPAPAVFPAGAVAKAGDAVHVILPVGYVPAEFRMKDETAGSVATLQQASRPTLRQDAATALAEGRFGSRPEVKSVLAGAAMHDPAPIVRAHCVTCLSKLGYCDPQYVAFLRQGTVDADPAVKAATAEALAKLEPRK